MPSTDRATFVMDALRRIVRALRTGGIATERKLGVSSAQLFVLRQLGEAESMAIGEIARRTVTAQSSVSEVVARLVERGLATRRTSSEDHRRAEVALTPAGRALLGEAPETVQERLLAAFRRLAPETQVTLGDGMRAWIAEAGLSEVAATMFFEPDAPPRRRARNSGVAQLP